jgi:hypothetical protein
VYPLVVGIRYCMIVGSMESVGSRCVEGSTTAVEYSISVAIGGQRRLPNKLVIVEGRDLSDVSVPCELRPGATSLFGSRSFVVRYP